MSDMISRAAAASEFADWYGFNYQSQSYYKWLKSASTVNPITCDTLEYLETAYTGARACDDVAEQVRLARAIAAYKQDVHEDCEVLDKVRAEMENLWKLKKSQGSPFYFGLGVALDIIDKYMAESEDKKMLGTQEQRTEGIKKQAQEVIDLTYQIGYEAGYEEGKGQAWSEEIKKYEIEPDKAREYIKQGRKEAWEAADTLNRMSIDDVLKVFADDPYCEYIDRESMFSFCSPELAIEKIKEYKNKEQENAKVILVGDEVYTEDKEIKFVVTRINEENAHLVDCKGNFAWTKTYCLNKTGQHFTEIENVLEKLKEENNG